MSEKWCGEGIPWWSQGQWQKMNTFPLTGESWFSELPCWGIFWYLSGPGKNLPPLPPCSPSGEFFWPPSSLHSRGQTVSPSSLIFHIFSSELAKKKLPNRSHGKANLVWGFSFLAVSDQQRKDDLLFLVLGWFLGTLEPRCSLFFKRLLFGHLTTLPRASISLLFPSFDSLPVGFCFNIIFSSRNLLHVCTVPCMVRSWGDCRW